MTHRHLVPTPRAAGSKESPKSSPRHQATFACQGKLVPAVLWAGFSPALSGKRVSTCRIPGSSSSGLAVNGICCRHAGSQSPPREVPHCSIAPTQSELSPLGTLNPYPHSQVYSLVTLPLPSTGSVPTSCPWFPCFLCRGPFPPG